MSGRYSERARAYLDAHAIDPEVAADAGGRELGDAVVFPYSAADGSRFERRRSLNGAAAKVRQPAGTPLTAWWPRRRPEGASMALVNEGESDALAALSALRRSPVPDLEGLPVVAIPGTGYPPARLAGELASVGCRQAWLALDADDAGRNYTERAIRELRDRGITPVPVVLPDGTDLADCLAAAEDPGDWLANALFDARAARDGDLRVTHPDIGGDPASAAGPHGGGNEMGLRIVALEDFVDVEEAGARALLGRDGEALIPEGGDVMLYGDGGAGKTTLAVASPSISVLATTGSGYVSSDRCACCSSRTKGRARSSARSSHASGRPGRARRWVAASGCSTSRGRRSPSATSSTARSSPRRFGTRSSMSWCSAPSPAWA
jgi:hypothetical protein